MKSTFFKQNDPSHLSRPWLRSNSSGHTFVEMLVVLSLIAILTASSLAFLRDLEEDDPTAQANAAAAAATEYQSALTDLRAKLR